MTPQAIADHYLAVWNAAEPELRDRLLAQAWNLQARYVDPMMRGEGHDGISTMIAQARSQFPGYGFVLSGTPDGHGDFVRFSWTLGIGDNPPAAHGTDIVRLDSHGKIVEVIGFLDAPAGAA